MNFFFCVLTAFVLTLTASPANAFIQSGDSTSDSSKDIMSDFDTWDLTKDTMMFRHAMPTVELLWRLSSRPSIHKNIFNGSLLDLGAAEIRIGTTQQIADTHNVNILKYSHNFIYLGNASRSWQSSEINSPGALETEAWSFGFGSSSGYAYKLGGQSDLTLYHSQGIGWTRIDFKDTTPDFRNNDVIHTFGDAFRFGTRFEGGMKVKVFTPLSLDLAYERAIVFPRHMFWYWLASEITEGAGQWFIDEFTDEVMGRSAYAAPVVSFVLKNALSYGFYELRRKNMNWPVQTTAPIMFESYKIGMTLAF